MTVQQNDIQANRSGQNIYHKRCSVFTLILTFISDDIKALNIGTMVKKLGLGLQSAVFIDDNPAERARVRDALPEVYVPEWPEDKMLYSKTLMELNCFSGHAVTEEDLQRTEYYFTNKKRDSAKTEAISFDGWLNTS